uniref:Uncharacterized protein n=1 Tax=Panagrolaimus superbus TaxID=310955 RepID=A0A914YNM9_9BILA
MELIIQDYHNLQELLNKAKTPKDTAKAHKDCHSVKELPMTNHIKVEETCHGVLHVIAGSLGAILDYAKSIDPQSVDKIINDAHVKFQGYNKKLTGNHGKILLNKIADGTVNYDGLADEILYIIAYIQKYAVARTIKQSEIQELKDCIEMFKTELYQEKYKTIYGKSQHIHDIVAHVMDFVNLHQSWGIFSDQPGEAIHKTQKQCFERIPVRIDNPIDRNQFFINHTIVRHALLQ